MKVLSKLCFSLWTTFEGSCCRSFSWSCSILFAVLFSRLFTSCVQNFKVNFPLTFLIYCSVYCRIFWSTFTSTSCFILKGLPALFPLPCLALCFCSASIHLLILSHRLPLFQGSPFRDDRIRTYTLNFWCYVNLFYALEWSCQKVVDSHVTWLNYLVPRKSRWSWYFRPFQASSFILARHRCQLCSFSWRGAESWPLFPQPEMYLHLKRTAAPKQSWLADSEAIRPEKTGCRIFLLYICR